MSKLYALTVVLVIVAVSSLLAIMIVFAPQVKEPTATVEVIYVTPQSTPEPNVFITCYSGGEVIFEGAGYDTLRHHAYDFSFGKVRWNDIDGSKHIFSSGEVCHIYDKK